MAEISDAALAELQRAHGLLKSLYDDGKVGMEFRKLVKTKYPDANIPELTAVAKTEELGTALEKRVAELGTGLTKKIDDFLASREKEKEENRVGDFEKRVSKVVKDRGYTQEGEQGLLKIMKDRNIADPEDAAILFEAGQPKTVKPRNFSTRMNFVSPEGDKDEQFKALLADPEQYAMDALLNAVEADRAAESE